MNIERTKAEIRKFFAKTRRSMSYGQFEDWMISYAKDAFMLGVKTGHEEYESLVDASEAEGYKNGFLDGSSVGETWTDDQIFELLRSERIGEERARRIVDKLCEGVENE